MAYSVVLSYFLSLFNSSGKPADRTKKPSQVLFTGRTRTKIGCKWKQKLVRDIISQWYIGTWRRRTCRECWSRILLGSNFYYYPFVSLPEMKYPYSNFTSHYFKWSRETGLFWDENKTSHVRKCSNQVSKTDNNLKWRINVENYLCSTWVRIKSVHQIFNFADSVTIWIPWYRPLS